jgi:hypothetical protein
MNLAAIFANEELGWKVMAYVKNVTDETALTGAFLSSDDTGLTTNVFLTEPRLYGIRVVKDFTGGPLLGSFGARRDGPNPFTLELGGQVQRQDTPTDALTPLFMDSQPAALNTAGSLGDSDLDWGDGREAKVTWRPDSGPWQVSAGVRFGKQNGSGRRHAEFETDPACAYGGAYYYKCPIFMYTQTNSSDLASVRHEEHQIIEFTVGRDLGLGGLSRSSVAAGLRYAQFTSAATANAQSIYWDFQHGWYIPYTSSYVRSRGDLKADREFEGTGPVLSWEASKSLLGSQDAGHVDIDWSIGGGVLFGKQTTSITGLETAALYERTGYEISRNYWLPRTGDLDETPVAIGRSRSVTVPMVDLSLGISYAIDGFRIGAGYRWERYFDALDGGQSEARDVDRTIDGPYFKIAVGFGG